MTALDVPPVAFAFDQPELPGYPALVAQVAERWMLGRWLPDPGSTL